MDNINNSAPPSPPSPPSEIDKLKNEIAQIEAAMKEIKDQIDNAPAQLAALKFELLVALSHNGSLTLTADQRAKLTAEIQRLRQEIKNFPFAVLQAAAQYQKLQQQRASLLKQLIALEKSQLGPQKLTSPFAAESQPGMADNPAFVAMAYASPSRPASDALLDLSDPRRWTVWTGASYASFAFGGAAPAAGSAGQGSAGAAYRFSPYFTAGLAVGGERNRLNTEYNGGYLNSTGTTVAPYGSLRLAPNIVLNAAAGATFLNMSFSDGTRTAQYDATRSFVAASLLGRWQYGAVRFSPSVNVVYGAVRAAGFTASDGMIFPGQTTHFGRISAGPEWGYKIPSARGWIEPFAFAAVGYDLGNTSSVVLADGTVFSAGKFDEKIGGGLKASSFDGWVGSIRASYDRLGSESRNSWTAAASLRLPF